MNHKSHLTAGILSGILISKTLNLNPYEMLLSVSTSSLFSILPDIDTPNSYIGHKLKITSHIINRIFHHRTITHSFILPSISLCISPFLYTGITYGIIVVSAYVGLISHVILDFLTPQGVPLLYPFNNHRFSLHKIFKI